jgi:hypothetical protein
LPFRGIGPTAEVRVVIREINYGFRFAGFGGGEDIYIIYMIYFLNPPPPPSRLTNLIVPMNEIARLNENVSKTLDWILIDSPGQLINKFFQIERALLLCPQFKEMGVSGIVVLLNV